MTNYLANQGKPWTPEDLKALERVYPDTDNATLGRIFRRSESSIQNQAINHGWRKSDAYMATKPGCFKPGLTPWNKGTHYVAPGSEHTRFRKGQKPPPRGAGVRHADLQRPRA